MHQFIKPQSNPTLLAVSERAGAGGRAGEPKAKRGNQCALSAARHKLHRNRLDNYNNTSEGFGDHVPLK